MLTWRGERRSYGYVIQIQVCNQFKGWDMNIEVKIDVTDKSLCFIRPYYVREEDKKVIDEEMKCLCYLGILKTIFTVSKSSYVN